MSDRDRRRPRTPPAGVRAQTASPVEDAASWDDELTPLPTDPREAMTRVDRRVKVTGQESLLRVDLLRQEMTGDLREVNRRIEAMSGQVSQLAAETAAAVARLDVVMADRQVDRQESSAVRVDATRTELEIRKSRELAEIREQAERSQHRRRLALKAVAGIGAVWGTISALILARSC